MNNYQPPANRCVSQPFVIVGCLIEEQGNFLFVHEGGKYNLPQGWLELGEDLAQGAKREAQEETGQAVEIISFRGIYPVVKIKNDKILHQVKIIYNAKLKESKINNSENLPLHWLSREQIASGKFEFWDNNILEIIMS